MDRLRKFRPPALWVAIVAFVLGAGAVALLNQPAENLERTAADSSSCGDVVVSAGSWLGGAGVDVHSNGNLQGSGTSCANNDSEVYDLTADPPTFGFGWQCVELANRLYATKGWYPRLALGPETNYGAKWLFTYAEQGKYSGLTAHANGSGYVPGALPPDLGHLNLGS